MPRILAVCGDPGGAKALVPVLARLHTAGAHAIVTMAYRQALEILRETSIPCSTLPESASDAAAEALLKQVQPDLLLSATSVNGEDWEPRFWRAARDQSVPSLAVLDYWSSYRRRFETPNGVRELPDRIAVMDETARDALIEEGFDPALLWITGQPALDDLADAPNRFPPSTLADLRAQLALGMDDLLVLLIGQPMVEVYGTELSAPGHPGYTEQSVVPRLITAIDRAAALLTAPVFLLIRPHPRDDPAKYLRMSAERVQIKVSSAGDHRGWVLASDLVIGMSSAPLLEAALLGRHVISFQPGLRGPDSLPSNRLGLSTAVYDESLIDAAIHKALSRTPTAQRSPHPLADGRATERVVALIEESLGVRPASTRTLDAAKPLLPH